MNLLHMKYAVEVARAGSLSKAAEHILVAQPNLSRAIKDLEHDLGIIIFERTSKGMTLTPEGEEFIGYASNILFQIDDVENLYKRGPAVKQRFSISVPRATYIADAFSYFCKQISGESAEVFYQETNSSRAIDNILEEGYSLGIIRYPAKYDKHFKILLEEKELEYRQIDQFHYVLIMNRENPIAKKPKICQRDLNNLIEIAHADLFVPSMPFSEVRKAELSKDISRRIFVFDRASQFNLLYDNPETYMWVSPIPRRVIDRFNLVQRVCSDNNKLFRDVLIYKKNYKLTEMDQAFIRELYHSKNTCFKNREVIDIER